MYLATKIVHILAWASWMAGMFYLPRIFVYHAESAKAGGEASEIFKVMERKLLHYIMRPAMLATWVTGLALVFVFDAADWRSDVWLWAKVALVVGMTGIHHMLGAWRRDFEADRNRRSGRFYRVMNEAPTLLFVLIVILVISRPF